MNKNDIQSAIETAHAKFAGCTDGANASYIPELAKVPSTLFGIAVVTKDGEVFSTGDADTPFAIESISKAFNLALVMDQIGSKTLREKIGADPTGEPFNSVLALVAHGGRPLNPLVNAGAMATVSLVAGENGEAVWANIMKRFAAFAGHPLKINDDVYASESATNSHNKGIAWLLDSAGYFYNQPDMIVDLYTRMCSLNITVKDLAVMGASYANGGVNPLTHEPAVQRENIAEILAELTMSGLYDSTGDWLYRTGLPAKSGVGGGIVTIVPNRMAIAAFSPPLDKYGNSVRAENALIDIIETLGLNPLKS
ncbi:glutaminase A [Akkermansia glycaniphila]|uniref:Glutaminase n=1 Tax=Akkermansia glycaniphila TaxID=1679444 RepID=A0A1C7P9Q8_9BACT|nr:glutaminase A [Akkermansia glycaniphila]OCA02235.1 glutaminase [Akkermansia glycaniphila]SEH98720.1 gln ase: glutaminase a [Akkermansia glycaniphila]